MFHNHICHPFRDPACKSPDHPAVYIIHRYRFAPQSPRIAVSARYFSYGKSSGGSGIIPFMYTSGGLLHQAVQRYREDLSTSSGFNTASSMHFPSIIPRKQYIRKLLWVYIVSRLETRSLCTTTRNADLFPGFSQRTFAGSLSHFHMASREAYLTGLTFHPARPDFIKHMQPAADLNDWHQY